MNFAVQDAITIIFDKWMEILAPILKNNMTKIKKIIGVFSEQISLHFNMGSFI